jgi:hypothetical protein
MRTIRFVGKGLCWWALGLGTLTTVQMSAVYFMLKVLELGGPAS